jgi:hypothetical protein
MPNDMTAAKVFAYGSNMLTERLRRRVPSARAICVATLSGYELRWHKVSKDGSGKCDVVKSPQKNVLGVVFEVLSSEKPVLDAEEGLGKGYEEMSVALDTANGPLKVQTYYATNIDPTIAPYTWYKALVIAGAKQHGLPDAYISALEQVAAEDDRDVERAKKNFALAASASVISPLASKGASDAVR